MQGEGANRPNYVDAMPDKAHTRPVESGRVGLAVALLLSLSGCSDTADVFFRRTLPLKNLAL